MSLEGWEKASLVGIGLMWGLFIGHHAPEWLFALCMGLAAIPTPLYAYHSIVAHRRMRGKA